jgi:hypothetical protein
VTKPPPTSASIRIRLVIDSPLPGVAHSLQDKASVPVGTKTATDAPLLFETTVRIGPKGNLVGEHVRAEGPERRFIYIAIGKQAGDRASPWDRRMKIDIHTIPNALLDRAAKGGVLEGVIAGRGKDGTPACATVPLAKPWRLARDPSGTK